MTKTFTIKESSSKKKNKHIVKKVIRGILIIAAILLFLNFIVPYVDWLISYLDSHPTYYRYFDCGDYYVCKHCQMVFVGMFKYLAVFTHLAGVLIGNVLMDSFGLFIVPDCLANLVLLVVLLFVIHFLRSKNKKRDAKKKSSKGHHSSKRTALRQTITISFSDNDK